MFVPLDKKMKHLELMPKMCWVVAGIADQSWAKKNHMKINPYPIRLVGKSYAKGSLMVRLHFINSVERNVYYLVHLKEGWNADDGDFVSFEMPEMSCMAEMVEACQ